MHFAKLTSSALSASVSRRPFQVNFFVTARCNARCRFCFYLEAIENANANVSKELTLAEIRTVFDRAGRLPYVSLSGGEPFLRRDLADIIDHIARVSDPLMISVPTNGAYTDRIVETFDDVSARHAHVQFEAQLSIDAPEADHDALRQVPGLYKRALDTNRRLAEVRRRRTNLGLKVVITYSAFNQHVVEPLIDTVEATFAFDRLILAKVHGNCDSAARDGLDWDTFRRLLERTRVINAARATTRGFVGNLSVRVKNRKEEMRDRIDRDRSLGRFCNAGRKIVVISETGDVHPCEVLGFKMGNLRDYDLDLPTLMEANYDRFVAAHPRAACHCDWGCAQNIALVTNPRFWPGLALSGR